MFDYERFRNDVLALGLMALVVFVGLSFLSYDPSDPPSDLVFPVRKTPVNICGSTGAAIAFYGRQILGVGVWMLMAAMIAWDVSLFSRDGAKRSWLTLSGTLLLITSSCAALHLAVPSLASGSMYGSGGVIGAWTGTALRTAFSPAGVVILVTCGLLSGWMLSPLWSVSGPGVKAVLLPWNLINGTGSALLAARQKPAASAVKEGGSAETTDDREIAIRMVRPETAVQDVSEEEAAPADESDVRDIRINPPVTLSVHRPEEEDGNSERHYDLPDLELLEDPEDFPYEELAKKARVAAATLEKTFEQFGLNIRVS
ncbi:MAG: DNA translocase FtsK 4TM domain-containing protein, partial [Planctomycetaceae bacterium]|nr:DNA translocase FtsK 4TM domain-containing protein [Planctomycetaceae bacterium]